MALLDSNGPLDKWSAFVALSFTTIWSLALVVEISAAEDLLRNFYTVFGLFDCGGTLSFAKGHSAAAGGAYAFPVFGLCIPFFLGTEAPVSRHARHMFGFWVWAGWTLYNLKYWMSDDPFGKSPANNFWLIHNTLMVGLHYQWVGKDVLHKFKLA